MSPRSKEQNEKIREERMTQIRLASVQVYLEKGFQAAEMGDIAKRAGMARGLIYYYFKDKTELFQTVFHRYFDEAKSFVAGTLLTEEPPLVRLERYARFYLQSAVSRPDFVFLYRNMQMDVPHVFGEQAKEVAMDFLTHVQGPLYRTTEEGVRTGALIDTDSQLLAQTFWGGIAGAMMELAQRRLPEEEANKMIDDVMQMLFRAIKK